MKTRFFSTKLLTALTIPCLVLLLALVSVFAAEPAAATADFTAADNGAAALALLNAAKTGTQESAWDPSSKTLVLRGVDFTTTATTAVKLPAGATIVLADGTKNMLTGGDSTETASGKHKNYVFVYGIYAVGELTIRGESNGTGTLCVTSGAYVNSGDAWTHSVAIYANGSIHIRGGSVTAAGGKASSADCSFSYGVQTTKGNSLSVSGGDLTAIGGETLDTGDEEVRKSFSRGIDVYKGNVTVSGAGKLTGKCVSSMDGEGLAYGVYISVGDLSVSDNAEVSGVATNAIVIFGGNLRQTGGKITGATTGTWEHGLSIERTDDSGGSVEISGGTLDITRGGLYMYNYKPTAAQGVLSVAGGTIKTSSIYGVNVFKVTGGAVESGSISTKSMTLTGGTVVIREKVQKSDYDGRMYTDPVLRCDTLTVSGGVLDAAWDWGEYTPVVFPADDYYDGDPTPLVSARVEASFSGGTTLLDTGCSGNAALIAGNVIVGSGVTETGADGRLQKYGDTPVVFSNVVRTNASASGIAIKTRAYDTTTAAQLDLSGVVLSGASASEVVETADGTVVYTVNAASLVNVSYDVVAAYLKTMRAGDSVELSYTFTGSGNYAGAKFDDGNGGRTDTGRISLQTVSGGFTGYVVSFDLCGELHRCCRIDGHHIEDGVSDYAFRRQAYADGRLFRRRVQRGLRDQSGTERRSNARPGRKTGSR